MTKINQSHLERAAYIYIRQSKPEQVQNNVESQRRQYGLTERARQLGFRDVHVIDEDLGRSGPDTWTVTASKRCWLPSAKGKSAPCSPSKPHGWRATATNGIDYWSSVALWTR